MNHERRKKKSLQSYLIPRLKDAFDFKKIEVYDVVLKETNESFGRIIKKGKKIGPVGRKVNTPGLIKGRIESYLDREGRWRVDRKTLKLEGDPQLELFFLGMKEVRKLKSFGLPKYVLKDNDVDLINLIEGSEIGERFDLSEGKHKMITVLREGKREGWIPNREVIKADRGTSLEEKLREISQGNEIKRAEFARNFVAFRSSENDS